jgi:hypothetical protein
MSCDVCIQSAAYAWRVPLLTARACSGVLRCVRKRLCSELVQDIHTCGASIHGRAGQVCMMLRSAYSLGPGQRWSGHLRAKGRSPDETASPCADGASALHEQSFIAADTNCTTVLSWLGSTLIAQPEQVAQESSTCLRQPTSQTNSHSCESTTLQHLPLMRRYVTNIITGVWVTPYSVMGQPQIGHPVVRNRTGHASLQAGEQKRSHSIAHTPIGTTVPLKGCRCLLCRLL